MVWQSPPLALLVVLTVAAPPQLSSDSCNHLEITSRRWLRGYFLGLFFRFVAKWFVIVVTSIVTGRNCLRRFRDLAAKAWSVIANLEVDWTRPSQHCAVHLLGKANVKILPISSPIRTMVWIVHCVSSA